MKPLVLVIDDHPMNLKLARWLLAAEGFEVAACPTAEDALEFLGRRLPDLVLVDLALPGMSGLEFTRTLRASADTRVLPIVAMTAFAMRGDEDEARAAGCDAYITKPVNTRTLAAQLRQAMDAAAQRPKLP